MKKYTIIHNFTATATIEVLAETREEAFEKARENELDLADYDFELDGAEIGCEEEIEEDLATLKEKAEKIIQELETKGKEIKLDPWPNITVEVYDGIGFRPRRELLEAIYWDDEREGIGLETFEGSTEMIIPDLPMIEQYNLYKSIIKKGGENA